MRPSVYMIRNKEALSQEVAYVKANVGVHVGVRQQRFLQPQLKSCIAPDAPIMAQSNKPTRGLLTALRTKEPLELLYRVFSTL